MNEIRLMESAEFPALLSEIPEPPLKLYVRGTIPSPESIFLAVVGSRKMSRYGKDACEYLIMGLADFPIVIVSGLALGIDAVAHKAALDAALTTVAIPGSGLDDSVLYPRANFRLAHEILNKGGALISEMEPNKSATPYSFPKRNRIMAGMCQATLIVEADEKSGTLITARLAVDYNRDLIVVPHSLFSDGGAGGHIFMKLGAKPVRKADDILETLGIESGATRKIISMNADEEKVITLLASPVSRDDLLRELDMTISEANVLLASMELRGLITESLGEVRKIS